MARFHEASVHGRFQPPHLDHLAYIEAGLEAAEHLIIGITQPEIVTLAACPEDPHRADSSANPFSYEERQAMISRMLMACGYLSSRFSFCRFPIEQPQKLTQFLPTNVVCLTTIRDKWNVIKVDRLRALGYTVEILWDKSDVEGIQGSRIRARMRANDDGWRTDVHSAVADYLISEGLLSHVLHKG
jgi:nicotinamide mononucleotide adenylyltransferase